MLGYVPAKTMPLLTRTGTTLVAALAAAAVASCSASIAQTPSVPAVRPSLPGDPVVAQPPAEGVQWDQFGFSLNGVRTEHM